MTIKIFYIWIITTVIGPKYFLFFKKLLHYHYSSISFNFNLINRGR